MRNLLLLGMICLSALCNAVDVSAAPPPVLFFSDMTSGPNTGLGDGKGSGVIVTVWGANLGSTQSTSTVQVGTATASQVYYWGNADGSKLAGPAVLFNNYMKIQTLSFSVPATAASGANTISVTVNGFQSNLLPFTVRPGATYFVATTGNDSNPGTFAQPWLTTNYAMDKAAQTRNLSGAAIYFMDGLVDTGTSIGQYYGPIIGSDATPVSYIAYPGATVLFPFGIGNWSTHLSQYINLSKIVGQSVNSVVMESYHGRIVGMEMTQNQKQPCNPNDQAGVVSAAGNGVTPMPAAGNKIYGNYVHNWGCSDLTQVSKLEHVFYMSNRTGSPIDPFDLGWNYLANNNAYHGLHTYDEGVCGGWTGPLLIHDNAVINQIGFGGGIQMGCNSGAVTGEADFYNNIFVNVGLDPIVQGHEVGLDFAGTTLAMTIKVYNNTFYGYGDTATNSGYAFGMTQNGSGCPVGPFYFKNNIIVNTKNFGFDNVNYCASGAPNTGNYPIASNNLWYNPVNPGQASPTWDVSPVRTNPNFISPPTVISDLVYSGGNLQLMTMNPVSPALGAGTNTSPIVTMDLLGTARNSPFAIGAYDNRVRPSPPTGLTVK